MTSVLDLCATCIHRGVTEYVTEYGNFYYCHFYQMLVDCDHDDEGTCLAWKGKR